LRTELCIHEVDVGADVGGTGGAPRSGPAAHGTTLTLDAPASGSGVPCGAGAGCPVVPTPAHQHYEKRRHAADTPGVDRIHQGDATPARLGNCQCGHLLLCPGEEHHQTTQRGRHTAPTECSQARDLSSLLWGGVCTRQRGHFRLRRGECVRNGRDGFPAQKRLARTETTTHTQTPPQPAAYIGLPNPHHHTQSR